MRVDAILVVVCRFLAIRLGRPARRFHQIIHMHRLRIRADAEQRAGRIKIHTPHAGRFTASPVLAEFLGVGKGKDTNDGPLVACRGEHGALGIDRERCDGGFVGLDHVGGGEGDGVKDHDAADGRGGCGRWLCG